MRSPRVIKSFCLILSSAALFAACGGGDDGGSTKSKGTGTKPGGTAGQMILPGAEAAKASLSANSKVVLVRLDKKGAERFAGKLETACFFYKDVTKKDAAAAKSGKKAAPTNDIVDVINAAGKVNGTDLRLTLDREAKNFDAKNDRLECTVRTVKFANTLRSYAQAASKNPKTGPLKLPKVIPSGNVVIGAERA